MMYKFCNFCQIFSLFYADLAIPGMIDLVDEGVAIEIGRFPIQTPLGARPGLGSQPRYEAPGNLRVKIVKTQ